MVLTKTLAVMTLTKLLWKILMGKNNNKMNKNDNNNNNDDNNNNNREVRNNKMFCKLKTKFVMSEFSSQPTSQCSVQIEQKMSEPKCHRRYWSHIMGLADQRSLRSPS